MSREAPAGGPRYGLLTRRRLGGLDDDAIAYLNPPGDVDEFTFVGQAGERIRVRVVETSGTLTAFTQLLRPDGTLLCSTTATNLDCTLDQSGTHTILVSDFGGDGGRSRHVGTAFIFNNAFIAGSPSIYFITLSTPDVKGVVSNNIFYGSDRIIGKKGGGLRGRNNWVRRSARVPSELSGTVRGRDPGFIGLRNRKFRLKSNSPCLNKGIAAGLLKYLDGDRKSHPCAPLKQIVFPMNFEARPSDHRLDLGAFEYGKADRLHQGARP